MFNQHAIICAIIYEFNISNKINLAHVKIIQTYLPKLRVVNHFFFLFFRLVRNGIGKESME